MDGQMVAHEMRTDHSAHADAYSAERFYMTPLAWLRERPVVGRAWSSGKPITAPAPPIHSHSLIQVFAYSGESLLHCDPTEYFPVHCDLSV